MQVERGTHIRLIVKNFQYTLIIPTVLEINLLVGSGGNLLRHLDKGVVSQTAQVLRGGANNIPYSVVGVIIPVAIGILNLLDAGVVVQIYLQAQTKTVLFVKS